MSATTDAELKERRKKRRGRPSKLNKEIQEELVSIIEKGNYIETACALVGLSTDTFYAWLRRGERERIRVEAGEKIDKDETPYRDFSYAIKEADAYAEQYGISIITEASKTQWQAMAWRQERRHPERWGKKPEVVQEMSGQDRSARIEEARTKLLEKLIK